MHKTPPAQTSNPDPGESQSTETDPTQTESGAGPADSTEDPDEGDEGDSGQEGDLPDWAREKLTKANSEAARYRTSLRDAEAKLKDAKTPEEFASATKVLSDSIAELERELVATKHNLPDDLASRLTGATREELEADAKLLQKYAKREHAPGDLKGGLDPEGADVPTYENPGELARQRRPRRR